VGGLAALALLAFTASPTKFTEPARAQVSLGDLHGPAYELVVAATNPTRAHLNVAPGALVAASVVDSEVAPAAPAIDSAPSDADVRATPAQKPIPYQGVIADAASKNGLPPEFLAAALSRESAGFREKYVRGWHEDGTGRGIAGIDKTYHPEVTDDEAFDPNFSINWMATELGELYRKHGNTYDASREYNGGPNFDS